MTDVYFRLWLHLTLCWGSHACTSRAAPTWHSLCSTDSCFIRPAEHRWPSLRHKNNTIKQLPRDFLIFISPHGVINMEGNYVSVWSLQSWTRSNAETRPEVARAPILPGIHFHLPRVNRAEPPRSVICTVFNEDTVGSAESIWNLKKKKKRKWFSADKTVRQQT